MLGKTKWADVEDDFVPTTQTKGRWAEMDDDEGMMPVIPAPSMGRQMGGFDKSGIRQQVEYLERDGKAIKKTTTIKSTTITRKSNRFVEARKQWANFGKCHEDSADAKIEYGSNLPVRQDEDIYIEMNKEKKMKSVGEEEKFWEQSIALCETIVNEATKKKWDASALRKQKEAEEIIREAEAPKTEGRPAKGAGRDGAYVPPSMRKDDDKKRDDGKENTLRVLNLSEDAKDGDLHALFAPFGKIQRVFLAKHREGPKVGQSKGFAFITYYERAQAEKAIRALNGHGYDSLILQVSWAKPKE